MGAKVRRGDLDETDDLRAAASAADGVIHLAFRHDLMQAGDRNGAASADLGAINAFAKALAGTGKPLVGTSGILLLAIANPGQVGTEEDVVHGGFRIDAENLVIGMADRGVRSSVVRLPPTVHSVVDTTGYIPTLIGIARDKGFAAYVGDGTNRWPAVHTLDAAHLFRLALENAVAGTRLHAVGDEGSRSLRSPAPSPATLASACAASNRAPRTTTSDFSPRSSSSTVPHRPRARRNCWGGSPTTQA